MPKTEKLRAYAKINIGLDVTGKREDGYHLIDTVMQQVSLYDELTFRERKDKDIVIHCSSSYVPVDGRNIVYKAVEAMKNISDIPGVDIDIRKRIPVSAGLAGGSSDGAAALKAVNEMFRLGFSQEKLCEIGAGLGADIPFCLTGGTVRCTGIGERFEKLPPLPGCAILLVKPKGGMSTKLVYSELDKIDYEHPDMDAVACAIRSGDIEAVCSSMGNVLENVTVRKYPEIEEIKKHMLEAGALGSLMSGSGTAVFGIFESEEAARPCFKYYRSKYLTYITKPGGNDHDSRF